MNPKTEIRVAALDDVKLIRELSLRIWPQTYESILSKDQIDYMMDLMYSETSLRNQITNENVCFLILSVNEKPVGFAAYNEPGQRIWKLHKIYILPEVQGIGAGRRLIEYIEHDIKSRNGIALQLQVNRDNTARSFYEKLGFKIIETADFDIGNGFFMNDYIMEKKF